MKVLIWFDGFYPIFIIGASIGVFRGAAYIIIILLIVLVDVHIPDLAVMSDTIGTAFRWAYKGVCFGRIYLLVRWGHVSA
ncbi:hypothetical protein N752_19560 [Desulforamulus aquiferis]|nr:hypothetical protein [Desulforamulus aquiferis]RYD03607.1 hypothetical protein N752_19560 [Desulforamulus aquiferis]